MTSGLWSGAVEVRLTMYLASCYGGQMKNKDMTGIDEETLDDGG
jgi:hypothetical protein